LKRLGSLRAGLDDREQVHRSRTLGEWSMMHDQLQDGFFAAGFFASWGLYYSEDFSSGKFQTYVKNDMVTNLATLFARGVL
jgi:hypothetical protein